MYIPM